MGQYSFLTSDTEEQIVIGNHPPVYMRDNKGNWWVEKNYEGYGVFGGKDFHVLLANMNGIFGTHEAVRMK